MPSKKFTDIRNDSANKAISKAEGRLVSYCEKEYGVQYTFKFTENQRTALIGAISSKVNSGNITSVGDAIYESVIEKASRNEFKNRKIGLMSYILPSFSDFWDMFSLEPEITTQDKKKVMIIPDRAGQIFKGICEELSAKLSQTQSKSGGVRL